ncbi:zinc finger BED domain-containing protein RICESLEEPER 2-like [Camellia sinensis]|uniref:zinc finger BED domain-containing protein RICESLEEPER 2-like n=1 Tax=Camellia sinensis TaxID=4442 RepID=UPI0010363265|nr:zinc finger BED domain-containing protein RICESLEEPER 2-like [Camellia sinensis]
MDNSINDVVNDVDVMIEIEDNERDNEKAVNDKNPFEKKSRKRTSQAWKEFTEVVLLDGTKKAQCHWSKTQFTIHVTGATTQVLRCYKFWGVTLSFSTIGSDSVTNVFSLTYDHAKVREAASHMILYHEYPFMKMEHVLFNKFMRTATPYWQKISRAIAKNDCVSTYDIQKKKLKALMKNVNRINITIDLWKLGKKIQYMVITAHFVDDDWQLQKRVLNFCNVPPPQIGVIIADALHKCLVEWGIENMVATITVDNASYNDVALRVLKENFAMKKKLLLGRKLFHIRYCAYILNIMVQYGLSEIGDIVDGVREGVKCLVASEARLLQFNEIVKQLYQERDLGFIYVPSLEDWIKVESVCQFLAIFNEVTNIIFGSDYPTSNLFLTEVWRIKETLNEKSVDDNEYI